MKEVLGPVAYKSLVDTVTERLRRAIVNGDVVAGQRLLETELAESFNVSRATVRQALLHLKNEDLVEMRPRRGAVVARMSREDSMQLCETRCLLESFGLKEALANLTADDLASMRRTAMAMGKALEDGDIMSLVELDDTFHRTIACQTANRRVKGLWLSLSPQMAALLSSTIEIRQLTPVKVAQRHLSVVDALETRDVPTAQAELVAHYTGIWPSDQEVAL